VRFYRNKAIKTLQVLDLGSTSFIDGLCNSAVYEGRNSVIPTGQSLSYGLQDRVIIITGAANGIGLATLDLFLANGAKIIAFDMDEAGLKTAALHRPSDTLACVIGDVANSDDWARAVDMAQTRFGGVDALFNNAGISGPRATILDYPEAEFDRVMAVNVRGVFLGIQHAGNAMKARGKGAIVNTSSIVGFTGGRNINAYTASKHAVIGLTKAAAVELAPHNIRVNAVCPSPTATEMMFKLERELAPDDPTSIRAAFASSSPMNRYGEPSEVAAAVAWLCSDGASYITGIALPIDGGMVAR
jgi:3alpha(or 20beta)-hydroxysteroid dehydrogenase